MFIILIVVTILQHIFAPKLITLSQWLIFDLPLDASFA